MNSNDQQSAEWTIQIVGDPNNIENLQKQIDAFVQKMRRDGTSCRLIPKPQSGMTITRIDRNPDPAEEVRTIMEQQGMPEEEITRQIMMINAQMGRGSWDEVVEDLEKQLAEIDENHDDEQKRFNMFMQLIEYAMNGGDKDKARKYLNQAESAYQKLTFDHDAHNLAQMYSGRIKKYQNWLN